MIGGPLPEGERLTGERLLELWRELNRPGAAKFRQALLARGIEAPSTKVLSENLLKYQSSKQIFAGPPKYLGKIFSPGIDQRWAADVLVNRASETEGREWKYALVVQDIFSRYAWAELIESPMHAAAALEKIIREAGRAPTELVVDADPGFQTREFRGLLERNQIHETVRAGRNDLATVDRLIFTLKRAFAEHAEETGHDDWAKRLQQVVAGYNHSPHPRLSNSDPAGLRKPGGAVGNKLVFFRREQEESENIFRNDRLIRERAAKLDGDGAFRVWKHKERLGRRVFEPHWSREIHRGGPTGNPAFVVDERGDAYPAKEILAVPKESTDLAGAPARVSAKAVGMLQRYADALRAFLLGQEDRRTTATKAHQVLSRVPGNFKEALTLAGVSADAPVKSFVGVFPTTFRLETSKKGGAAHVQLLAA